MAYATQLTIGTGNKVSINYQSQDVSVSLTYQLEHGDTDVLQVVQEKAVEVAQAHQTAWQRIRDARVEGAKVEVVQSSPQTSPIVETTPPLAGEPPPAWSAHEVSSAQDEATTDEVATAGQQATLHAILSHLGWSEAQVRDYLATHFSGASIACNSIEQMTQRQASQWLLELQRNEREKAQQRRQRAVPLNGKPIPS